MEEKLARKRRVLLVPAPAQGHITPMIQLATILHLKGFSITIAQTKFNYLNPSNNLSDFQFVTISENLQESDLKNLGPGRFMIKLAKECCVSFEKWLGLFLLQQQSDNEEIACVFYDEFMYFVEAAVKKFKLPNVILSTTSATSFVCRFVMCQLYAKDGLASLKEGGGREKELVPELYTIRIVDLVLQSREMAIFSICGGDDGEGSSNHGSRKRQRLPSIDEEESDAGSSGEEDDEETQIRQEDNRLERRIVSDDGGSTSDDSDREVVIVERRNTESSSSKDSSLSVTLLDPDVLDCPICCEPLKTPIFQCDNGHLACSVCCTKVRNRCPSCTLPIGYIRCRAMEKVIESSRVSCPNAKYGCKEIMLCGNRFSHEKLCVYTPCSCPIGNCDYTGYYQDLNKHVRLKHKDDVITFSFDSSVSISLGPHEKTTVLQDEDYGEVIVVQVFKGLHVVYVSVNCIQPLSVRVGTLSCCLVNRTIDSSLRQGFIVKNIQKVGNEQPEDGFMAIPSYILSASLQVSIGRSRFFLHH